MIGSARMKFASEARASQYIVPFDNTEPTCMPLSGHFIDIEDRVLVHQTEMYKLSLTYNAHGDKERFLVLILHHLYPVLSRSDDTSIPFADFSCYISHS